MSSQHLRLANFFGLKPLAIAAAWVAVIYGSVLLMHVEMPYLHGLCGEWG